MANLLGGHPLDFVFIDGDHHYEAVKRDFELYSTLMQPGGHIAFHDVAPQPAHSGNEVERFWTELKRSYACDEIRENPTRPGAGIGIVSV